VSKTRWMELMTCLAVGYLEVFNKTVAKDTSHGRYRLVKTKDFKGSVHARSPFLFSPYSPDRSRPALPKGPCCAGTQDAHMESKRPRPEDHLLPASGEDRL
jgi:hypothetical protein